MLRADLVLTKHGSPFIVAEAKERPVPAAFERAVLAQLRLYAQSTNSRWLLLIDPTSLRVYKGKRLASVASIPTKSIIKAAGLSGAETVGERLLLVALERWLSGLPKSQGLLAKHPELKEFFDAVAQADSIETEVTLE